MFITGINSYIWFGWLTKLKIDHLNLKDRQRQYSKYYYLTIFIVFSPFLKAGIFFST